MDLLNGKIRPIYFKYLSAAFGSALIASIYSIVDMAMVGQYHGTGGDGGSGGCGAGLEYYIQPRPADGDRRQRHFQHKARRNGEKQRRRKPVFHGGGNWRG